MSDFEDRLKNAIERGQKRSGAKAEAEKEKALSREEIKRLHSNYRLQLSDKIEKCIAILPDHFPGFEVETIYGEKGWGAACSRDDIISEKGRSQNHYSRFEMTVRPHNDLNVIDLAAKGTVLNKELLRRQHFEDVEKLDVEKFLQLVDTWTLEYAEIYASKM